VFNLETGKYTATSISGTAFADAGLDVSFTSSDSELSCTLSIATSTKSHTNTVSGTCNGTPITFSNVGVNVTG
jgi:hypothetical protein